MLKLKKSLNYLLLILSIIIALAAIEFISSLFLKTHYVRDNGVSTFEYRMGSPPAYSDKKIYDEQFLTDSFNAFNIEFTDTAFRLKDYKSKNINVIDSLRVTLYQNKNAENLIHIFGGSSIYCQEVKDDHTVASYLQKMINDLSKNYNVINHGVPAYMTKHQVMKLKEISLNKRDIVIFYSGNNDITFIVDRDDKDGVTAESGFRRAQHNIKHYNFYEKLILNTYLKFPKSKFFKLLYKNITIPNLIGIGVHKKSLDENLKYLADNYIEQLFIAKKFTLDQKAYFYNFLQPNLYIKKVETLTEEEKFIISNEVKISHSSKIPYELAYPMLKKELKLKFKDLSYDLTSIFDELTEDIYLDFIHVNHIGNEIIAKSIFKYIKKNIIID